ncbi:cytochrome P450 81E8-like [Cucurbita pepo subsp. pepo]|uniref:cytochrome P450 81E8-like n=1 Tax=Cucurbita pepo subsp. pepo TaxID=3664 RepID=UPI000C9D32B8|nr:cytochrome P450 81E8-like [Cucurbita pepo subsp. pepo]
MDLHTFLYSFFSTLFLLFAFNLITRSLRLRKNLPPSPPSLPVIGHLHLLKKPLHRNFQNLSAKYGPVMSLRLGSNLAVVVSSSSAVEECFTKNDVVLANRPRLLIGKYLGYNYTTMIGASYGDHWRNLRRIGAIEIFSSSRINKFADIRRDEVKRLVRKLSRNSIHQYSKVEMQSALSEMTFNISMRMAAVKRYYGEDVTDKEEARRFRELIKEIVAAGGVSNPGDFFPILNWISKGFERKLIELGKKVDAFLQGLIDDHRRKKEESRNTMIDHLLSLQESQPAVYDDQIIKGFILVLLTAGTDTSAVTVEWALCHLLNNPEVLKKARDEIDTQIGQERLVEEPDVSKLPYLQGIISETLRLTPAAPMLLPHYAANDCTIHGYDVPRDTMLLVNAWAIHRDPNEWEDPLSFKPERYEKSEVEVHKLLSFGVGRRACPGSAMAHRIMGLTLGALIQCFEWERIGAEDLDMNERVGATMTKMVPLEAMCRARPTVDNLLD